jgi:hypothetical protein
MSASPPFTSLPETLTRLVEQRQLTVSDAHRFLAQAGLGAGSAVHEAGQVNKRVGEP